MRRIVLVLCFFLVAMSVNCADEKCGDGDNVTVSSVPSGITCEEEYNGSNVSQLFGDIKISLCNDFFTADFSQIPVTSWRDSFTKCIMLEATISMNIVLQKTQPQQQLLSARCFKNNSFLVDACECRMDCLLEFSNTIPTGYLIYLKDIGCNESDLSTSLISAYNNASNVIPRIEMKPEYMNCTTQDPVSSSLIVPVSPSTSTGITTTSSQDPVIVTPTNTAPTCVDYDMQGFNTSAAYCQCSDSTYTSTAYNKLLGQACNSTASSNWYFKPTTTGLAPLSVVQQCARDSNVAQLQQLFNLTDCSSDVGWNLTRVVCECSTQTDCPVNALLSTSIADCVLHFTRHDQPYNTSLVFIQGLDRKNLNYYNSCLVDLQIPDCTTFPPTASTSTTVTQESTTPPVGMNYQLALGVVGGVLVLLTLSFVMIIVVLVLKRRRNANFYEPESKTRDECSSPQTITSETALSPVNTSSFNWGNKMATSGAFGLVQKGLLKGKNDRCVHIAIKAMKENEAYGTTAGEDTYERVNETLVKGTAKQDAWKMEDDSFLISHFQENEAYGMVNQDPGYKRTSTLDCNRVYDTLIIQDNVRVDDGIDRNCVIYSGVESTAPQVVEHVYISGKSAIQEPIYSHVNLPTSENNGTRSDAKEERDRVYSEAETLAVQEHDRIYSEADTLAVQERVSYSETEQQNIC